MSAHPEMQSPPTMEFGITAKYKDCLSRQIGEALRIHNSTDIILNSKSEYMANSVRRLTVEEDVWERRDRSRREQEEEEMIKKRVDEFRTSKISNRAPGNRAPEIPTIVPATKLEQEPPKISKNTAKQDLKPPILNTQSTVTDEIAYETDEDEFGGVGEDDIPLEMGRRLDTTSPEVPVLMEMMEEQCEPQGVMRYETDEDEFWRPDQEHPVPICKIKKKSRRKNVKGYQLAYFSLW